MHKQTTNPAGIQWVDPRGHRILLAQTCASGPCAAVETGGGTELDIAMAERRQAEADLAGLSLLDDLTGIPNQYCFDQTIGRKYTRARRASISLSLILIKIDYYVAFQRHYGNQVAEDCLCQVAIGLTRILKRPTDLVTRCINDQFLHRF